MDRAPSPEEHLWSSILDSVSSSRAIPSRNVIILGEPNTGKSTLSNALLQKSSQLDRARTDNEGGINSTRDFAIGYEWGNVKDDAEEDTLARLSVYTVPSSSPAHLALIPHFLPPKTSLLQTLVIIALDWTRPSTFIDQLRTWLAWVDKWAQGDGARELEVMREEGKEKLQSHIQWYTEPTTNPDAPTLPGSLASTLLPLGQGVFTHNRFGVPIAVVCTKADKIDDDHAAAAGLGGGMGGFSKAKGAGWEERTDGIMQVLRTICLKYGAALFYTSSSQPVSLVQLRSYALHILFMPPPPPPDQPPLKYLFPFRQKANLLDRDRIVVPARWDSWGKIGVVREGFECKKWEEAWERDVEEGSSEPTPGGASEMFRSLVGFTDVDETPSLPAFITTEPEQAFLAKHYETLAKDRDPRHQFRDHQHPGEQSNAGVVGPMGSSSFSMPTVERALEQMETEDASTRLARMGSGSSRDARGVAPDLAPLAVPGRVPNGALPPSRPGSSLSVANNLAASSSNPTSPGTATSAAGGKSQHEVLQKFFESLLQKGSGASTSAAGTPAAGAPPTDPGARLAQPSTDDTDSRDS